MKILLTILILISLVIIQVSFIPALPAPFYNINIIIIILVLFLILNNLEDALIWGVFAGIFLDLHSFHFFSLNILSIVITLILTYLFSAKFLTNRSIYSFVFLTSIALFIFEFTRFLLIFLFIFFTEGALYYEIFSVNYSTSLIYKLLFSIIITFISFYSINYYSKKMKSFFISVKK